MKTLNSATSPVRSRRWPDFALGACAWLAGALVAGGFVAVLVSILGRGLARLSWDFLVQAPSHFGREGGIGPIIVSTSLLLLVALAATLPLGMGAAAFIAEFTSPRGRFGRIIRLSLDALAGTPSIVFGLFGNAFFCVLLGLKFSILSGGLTLACMALPLFIRAAEEGFRSAPQSMRFGAAALGMTRRRTLFSLLLPAAAPGILVGIVLSIGRAVTETAALIFTSGYVDRMPRSLFDSGRSLSIHIYDLSMNVSGGDDTAAATALVLLGLTLALFGSASWITSRWLRRRGDEA